MTVLDDNRGSVIIQTIGIITLMLIVIVPVYIYARSLIISHGVNNAVRNAMISAVSINYYPSYDGMREGNSGAYGKAEGTWKSGLIPAGASGISSEMGLTCDGGDYVKYDSAGKVQYEISNIQSSIKNADFALNGRKLSANVSYTLKIPVTVFGFKTEQSIHMQTGAEFEQKF